MATEFNAENMKFEKLTDKQCDYVYGRLKMLEEMKQQIEVQMECYTRLLLVNGKEEDKEFNDSVMEHEKILEPIEEVEEIVIAPSASLPAPSGDPVVVI